MTISNVALINTFDEWRVTTNQLIVAINGITEGNSNVNFVTANAIVVAGVNVGTTLAAAFNQANTANVAAFSANAASGVVASTYGGATQIPVFTVDTRGKLSSASNVAVQGMDYAYANSIGAASNGWANTVAAGANAWSNTKVSSVSGTAGEIYSSGGNTPTLNLITTGVTAATYGGATNVSVITVDTRGRITSASNVSVSGMDYAYVNTFTKNTNSNLFTGRQSGSITTLTASSNVFTPDFSSNNYFTLTLANNETLANATNTTVGTSGAIFVKQSMAGNKTLSFGLGYKFTDNTVPTISVAANAVDMIIYTVRTANSYICDIIQNAGDTNDS